MIYAENILLCIAIPLVISLLFVRGDVRRYTAAFLFGMGVSLIAAYISGVLNLISGMGENDTSVILCPIVEELMKLMPLLFFIVLFTPEEHTLTMLAVAIGAGFATFENCCYILTSGAESFTFIMIRGLAVGVMHIVSILALAVWFIIAKHLQVFSFSSIIGGLSLSMVFHALYNLLVSEPGVSRYIGYLLPLLAAAGLYYLYRKLPHRL